MDLLNAIDMKSAQRTALQCFLQEVVDLAPEYSVLKESNECDWGKRIVLDGEGNVTEMNLSDLGLEEIPASLGSLNWGLRKLVLASNSLRSLPASGADLTSLEVLVIDNNLMKDVPACVAGMSGLKNLMFRMNPGLRRMTTDLSGLQNMEWVDISQNQRLEEIPIWMYEMRSLRQLDVHSCKICSVAESIGNLSKLAHMSLHSNELVALPETLGACTAMTWLSLNSNMLESVPESIGNLRQLVRLSLHINRLSKVPESLCNCTRLEALSLHSNMLKKGSIPDAFSRLRECLRLSLYHNPHLGEIPDGVCGMVSLKELWLYDCGIQQVNSQIAKLIHLQKLWLDRNPIRSVPDALLSLTMLQELYLDQTDVSEFPDYFREALPNLKIVALNTTQ